MKFRPIVYWTTTALIVFTVLSGGLGELAHQWGTLETVQVLGYPTYFLTILGLWKLLGGIALLVPRFPRLREWAYAGIFFNMTGAAASHAFSSDYGPYGFHVIVPAAVAVLVLVSRAFVPPAAASKVPLAAHWAHNGVPGSAAVPSS
jgi:uncharacterized membrane protein YphA (DoxX/SURF4 family)